MRLDARSVLSAAFMRARGAYDGLPKTLEVTRAVAAVVDQTNRFDVERAPFDLSGFDPRELAEAPDPLPLTDRRVFDVCRHALDDLQRVDALASRNLGYAFHSLPELGAAPFDRNLYAFSLRFVAFCWPQLSAPLKLALARLLDIEPVELEARVTADGFARSMY